jgi:cytochrome b
MRSGLKPTIVLLAVLGIGDLAAVPLMAAAHHHNPSQPPLPAIVAAAIIGLVTLASAAGLARDRRFSSPAALTCRVLDSASALLGLAAHPNAALVTVAAVTLVLSVAAIVLLLRLNHRKNHHGAVAQPSPSARSRA